ncbi:MAG: DNA repair protein RadC [Clostridiales bacterium]|nr:DNA repair protein RadC [Clostridiales bacterium]
MEQLNRNGHRKRMRESYLSGDMKNAPDHNLLELFLSVIIPQKDVKPLAYDLINTFGSLEKVISAKPQELMKLDGIGESCAVEISLIKTIYDRTIENKNKSITKINAVETAMTYCKNKLIFRTDECLLMICLDNDGCIIADHIISEGSVNMANINLKQIVEIILRDNAAGILIAHNHPNGSADASAHDLNFTIELRNYLDKINIQLVDHIIVGKDDCTAIKSNPEYYIL